MKQYLLSAFADEYADSLPEQLDALDRFKIPYIELRFIDGISISHLPKNRITDIKQQLKDRGIGISAIGSPLGKIPLDGDLDGHMDMARKTFETARELDAENIRIFSFYPPQGESIRQCRSKVLDTLGTMLDIADKYNVVLCHENEAGIFGESPEACLDLFKNLGSRLGCVFDMGNFALEGYEPNHRAYRLLKDHITYFHIKDALSAGAIVPPGEGEARIQDILGSFKKEGKGNVFITLEPHLQTFSGLNAIASKGFDNPWKYPDRETAFADAVTRLKNILEAIK